MCFIFEIDFSLCKISGMIKEYQLQYSCLFQLKDKMLMKRTDKRQFLSKGNVIKFFLILLNIVLVLSSITFSLSYSKKLQDEQTKSELDTFESTVESMKQISDNYLRMELNYAKDWAKYIGSNNMDIQEALDYINQTNNQKDRYAHIVDMETFLAYSTHEKDGNNQVTCYQKFYHDENDTNKIFIQTMRQMYAPDIDEFNILGKYRTDDTQLNVISVGTQVSLTSKEGEQRHYLLLRIIPVESIRNIWIFPVEYRSAELGIITKSGGYVVQSKSMKSRTFADFIRGYNFEDDYNKVDELVKVLSTTESGLLTYKNSKGEDCYWYYSSFGETLGLDILGYIPVDALNTHKTDWTIVLMTCGLLFLLIVLDGTYILHINRRLRETAKLAEAASLSKTRFLSTMSHDIRTPMNGIIGMTNIAKTHIHEPEQLKECLDKVSLASDHLLTLINDILDISKVESGNMVLSPAAFSIEQLIDHLVDIMQVQIAEKEISFQIKKNLPVPYLIADELRLNQIFINILTNAVKYTQKQGKIELTLSEEILPDNQVRLLYRVSDNGIGMSEEFQKTMYSRFSRELDSRINKTQGTGLGLAIVKQMVELMHGTLECQSALGEGTTFTITFELKQASDEEANALMKASQPDEQTYRFDNLNILIAEDNDLNWEIIHELLKELDVNCERVENGQLCVDTIENAPEGTYDFILMDVQMPVMNGKEATKTIRQSKKPFVQNIPIIAMTADAFAEDIQDCLDCGMNGHIAKPVDMKKVIEILKQISVKKMEEIK